MSSKSPSLHHPLWAMLKPSRHPSDCERRFAEAMPLRRFEALTPLPAWWHRDGVQPVRSLKLLATVGSPFLLETLHQSLQWLLVVHDGNATVQHSLGTGELGLNGGGILPSQPWTLIAERNCSLTAIGFDPLRLLTTARGMAPIGWSPHVEQGNHLHVFLRLPTEEDPTCAALVNAISLLLPAIHHLAELGDQFLESLLLHQQLYRILAALVFADLRDGHEQTDQKTPKSDRRLDRVLDYISLHLDQPLPLSVLESESNYCRRTLHYAFQERFGCSPKQWIRQQRMALALQRLQHPHPGDTVASIAQACGYRSLGRFSIDFQGLYGVKPSAVLRGKEEPSLSNNTTSLEP